MVITENFADQVARLKQSRPDLALDLERAEALALHADHHPLFLAALGRALEKAEKDSSAGARQELQKTLLNAEHIVQTMKPERPHPGRLLALFIIAGFLAYLIYLYAVPLYTEHIANYLFIGLGPGILALIMALHRQNQNIQYAFLLNTLVFFFVGFVFFKTRPELHALTHYVYYGSLMAALILLLRRIGNFHSQKR